MENGFSWNKVLGVSDEDLNQSPIPLPLSELEKKAGNLTAPQSQDWGGTDKTQNLNSNAKEAPRAFVKDDLASLAQSAENVPSIEWKSDPNSHGFNQKDINKSQSEPSLTISDEILNSVPKIVKSHYAPAAIDPKIHNIDVSEHRFDGPEGAPAQMPTPIDLKPIANVHIDDILREAIERKASDVHLTAGLPPMIRVDGELMSLSYRNLTPEDTKRIIFDTLTDDRIEKYENTHELDFAYTVRGLSRFRFNAYMQRGSVAAALRAIPAKIPAFDVLGLPPIVREMSKRTSGLILVTGPTGSGKSTTIASMIDEINETRNNHIITMEDPIEYLHNHKKCMVNQREIHSDSFSFGNALRAVLREDPDIILVGELRDLETIEAALTLAETGHLVFGTLHTRNAPATIDRIVDVFPSDQQAQIRVLLGNTLEAVVSQQLIPKLGGGRCAAIEIMLGSAAIKNLIREGKTHQMYSMIETGSQHGMQTMDASLAAHFRNGFCAYDDLLMAAVDKESFSRLAKSAA